MRRVVLTGVWLAVALVVPAPAPAHHSFAAYESTQTRTLRGTVETFQWINPHVAFKLRVEPDGGRLHTVVVLDTGQTLKTKLSAGAKPDLK